MARIRTIKPEFPHSESMGSVSRDARLTFILLWTIADDSGRLRGNSRMLASLLFPYDLDAPKLIDKWLSELVNKKAITRYLIDDANYIQIENWHKHQKIDKPSASKIPQSSESSRILSNPLEDSSGDLRTKDQGPKDLYMSEFEEFWKVYPRREAKSKAVESFAKAMKLTTKETILDGARQYAEACKDIERTSIAHPSTWLNQARWEDDLGGKKRFGWET